MGYTGRVSLIAIGAPGWGQIIIVLALLLLFFGSSRLPKMARSLGASLTEFKKGLRGDPEEEKKKLEESSGGEGDGDDEKPA